MSRYLIYGLFDPRTSELRYVGKSCSGMVRPGQHFTPTGLRREAKTHKTNWIKTVLADGLVPEIEVLEVCESAVELVEAERFFIEYFRSLGCRLTNMTVGGDGGGPKWSDARRLKATGRKLTPEHRANIGAAGIGRKMPAEAIEKTAASRRGLKHTDEAKAKMSAKMMGRVHSAETKAKMAESHKSPENIAAIKLRQTGKIPSEATRAKMSAAHKGQTAKSVICSNGITYPSLTDASSKLSLSIGNISLCISGKRKTVGGLTFSFLQKEAN